MVVVEEEAGARLSTAITRKALLIKCNSVLRRPSIRAFTSIRGSTMWPAQLEPTLVEAKTLRVITTIMRLAVAIAVTYIHSIAVARATRRIR